VYHESYSLNSGKKIKYRTISEKNTLRVKNWAKVFGRLSLKKYTQLKVDRKTLVFQGGKV